MSETLWGADAPPVREAGDRVAWVEKRIVGRRRLTEGFSLVHRYLDQGETYCGLEVPPPHSHFPPLPTLETCARCDRLHDLGVTFDEVMKYRIQELSA